MAEPSPVLPSWRYHVSGEARIVATVEDLQALPAGEWFETPEAARAARAAPPEETSSARSRR